MKKNCFLLFLLSVVYTVDGQTRADEYKMSPDGAANVAVGTKLVFKIFSLDADGSIVPPPVELTGKWTINGQEHPDPSVGKLSTSLNYITATYQAPEQVPAKNPVAIAFTFELPDSGKTKLILVCNVTIVNSTNFFDLAPNGGLNTHYKFDDPYAGSMAHAAMTMAIEKEGELIINIQGKAPSAPGDRSVPATMSMVISVDGVGKGVYEWKLPSESQSAPITGVNINYNKMGGLRFAYVSVDCLPHHDIFKPDNDKCKGFTLKGSTTITKYENPGNVEGYFSGVVMEIDPSGKYIYGNVYGRFSGILQKIPGQ
jgi:hypothetical protein